MASCDYCGAPPDGRSACRFCGTVRSTPAATPPPKNTADVARTLATLAAVGEEIRKFAANPYDRSALVRMNNIRLSVAPGKPVFG